MRNNYKKCPKCGSSNSIQIVYGLVDSEFGEEAEKGNIMLGGCCWTKGHDPEYHCKDCKHEWNKQDIKNKK